MKSIKSALLAYSSAKFILAIGTFAFLFIVGYGFVTINQTSWVLTFLTSFLALMCGFGLGMVGLFIFDGGFDHLEDVGRDANGQESEKAKALGVQYSHMSKQERVMSYVLGTAGVIGSTVISIVAAGVFAFSVTDDKSSVSKDMQSTQADADKTYNTELSIAQAAVARAQSQLDAATAKRETATQDAIAAIGGDFAARKRRSDEWVEVAAVYSKSRAEVRKAQENADAAKAQAEAQLAQTSATLNDVLRNGKNRATAGVAPVLQAQQFVLETWMKKVSNLRSLVVRTDLVAGFFSLVFYFFLRIKRALPDEPTILGQLMRLARLTSNATVYALDVTVTSAERALEGKVGIVAHPNAATVTHSLQAQPNAANATQPQQSATVATAQLNATSATVASQPQPQQMPAQRRQTQPGATAKKRASIQSAIRMARTRSRAALAQLEAGDITQERYDEIVLRENDNIARNEARLNAL
jgi:hypothetical protein